MILTSLLCFNEERTPVVTRSESPCLSICSASLFTSSIFFADVAESSSGSGFPSPSRRGGVSSPATEDAPEAVLLPALDRLATVFLGTAHNVSDRAEIKSAHRACTFAFSGGSRLLGFSSSLGCRNHCDRVV